MSGERGRVAEQTPRAEPAATSAGRIWSSLWPALVLVVTYALMAVLLRPNYDWPVIDSWAFGYTVRQLLATGRYIFVDWGAMSLFAHVGWGALFSLPAGFSFAALNVSTFALSFVASVATFLTLRDLLRERATGEAPAQGGSTLALLGVGVLVVNPAYVLLSYSYMTDVPFLAWFSLSVWCDTRGLLRNDWRWLALGSVFAALATLIRQNGIVLPAALGAYLLWQWVRRRRSFPWKEGIAGAGLPLVVLIGLTALSWAGVMPNRTNALAWISGRPSPAYWVINLFRILMYLGLFALPLTLSVALGRRSGERRRLSLSSLRPYVLPTVLFAVIGTVALVQYRHPFKLPYLGAWRMMPYFPAAWSIFGTGSREEWLAGSREMILGYRFWVGITALSCLGAALLLWPLFRQIWQRLRSSEREAPSVGWPAGFLVLLIVAYLAPVLLFKGEIYDRYLIGLLLPAAALVLRAIQWEGVRPSVPAFVIAAALFLAFSLALTGEFVQWNGAAWRAAGRLVAQGIPIERIDGGFVWNGWHFAEQVRKVDQQPEAGAPAYMELTPQIRRDYVVSFSALDGYEATDREPYWSPLHWSPEELLILHRRGG